MKTIISRGPLGAATAIASIFAAFLQPAIAADPVEWEISSRTDSGRDNVYLDLRMHSRHGGRMNSSNQVPLATLDGLSSSSLISPEPSPVSFAIVREAGRLDCTGEVSRGAGTGTCDFTADPAFTAALAARNIETPNDHELFVLTTTDARIGTIDALASEGYDGLDLDDFLAVTIHGVNGAQIEDLAAAGVRNVHVVTGDGTLGLPDHAPFDAIVAAAAGPDVPLPWLDQLADGGCIVMPLEQGGGQHLVRVTRPTDGEPVIERLESVRFVPLVGEHGWHRDARS